MELVTEFDYKMAWQLTLYALHFKMLTFTCKTSTLLCVNCRNKLPLFDDTVLRYAV